MQDTSLTFCSASSWSRLIATLIFLRFACFRERKYREAPKSWGAKSRCVPRNCSLKLIIMYLGRNWQAIEGPIISLRWYYLKHIKGSSSNPMRLASWRIPSVSQIPFCNTTYSVSPLKNYSKMSFDQKIQHPFKPNLQNSRHLHLIRPLCRTHGHILGLEPLKIISKTVSYESPLEIDVHYGYREFIRYYLFYTFGLSFLWPASVSYN